MIDPGFIIPILLYCSSSNAQNAKRKAEIQEKFDDWRFKDFMQKFDPRTVWEKVNKLQAMGKTDASYLDLMFQNMDETDDLLKLNVQKIGPPPKGTKLHTVDEMINETRRFQPSADITWVWKDRFDYRARLYELMKQAIYQARNAMVIMQIMRDKYRHSPLYKMGFLMSKTDNAVKTFYKVSYRNFKACTLTRSRTIDRNYQYDLLVMQERNLNLLFNAELLIDLVTRNDKNCSEVLQNVVEKRVEAWKFQD